MSIVGQYFTNKNVFDNHVFLNWFSNIPKKYKKVILEPFAGKNGIIDMLLTLNLINDSGFYSCDIDPKNNLVHKNDSFKNFPNNFDLCITNPPFLAKNTATRKNINIQIEPFNDLYEKSLDICLKNCKYVAAIVPDSFIVSPFFKSRLFAVISLTDKNLFKNTEHPVCLALFSPNKVKDFDVYIDDKYIGKYNKKLNFINKTFFKYNNKTFFTLHDSKGQVGLINIDATDVSKSIKFVSGESINEKEISSSYSRLRTKLSIYDLNNNFVTDNKTIQLFINNCNYFLEEYRHLSSDIFLTSFKGLRSDGRYRKRLDYQTARSIINIAYIKTFYD